MYSILSVIPSLERQSENTVVSVNFYYTPEFSRITADPVGGVHSLVNNANVGYANSLVPLKLKVFCVQMLDGFVESERGSSMLSAFRTAKGSETNTLNTADAAILVLSTLRGGACGIAYDTLRHPARGIMGFTVLPKGRDGSPRAGAQSAEARGLPSLPEGSP
jgi:hypothetical protein